MNTSFKTGDTAEFTENYMGHKVGEQFTVTAVEPSGVHKGEQLVQGRRSNNHSGVFSHRLKLVETPVKIGDKVRITIPAGDEEAFGGAYFQTGTGTVDQVHSNGKRLLVRGTAVKDGSGPWWVDKKFVTPLAEELPFEVGARVRSKVGYLDGASEGIVTRLEGDFGGDIEIAWDKGYTLAGATCGATRSKLTVITSPVVERPAVKVGATVEATRYLWSRVPKGTRLVVASLHDSGSLRASVEGSGDSFEWHIASDAYKLVPSTPAKKAIPATETKPQIGDTIVAFWGDLSKGEVETRAKGVVARIDEDGNYEAADGSCIDWDEEFSPETSDSVFIVERAAKPEPVKVNPFAEAKVGSIATYGESGVKYLKKAEDAWAPISEKGVVAGHRNSDFDMHDNGNVSVTYNA